MNETTGHYSPESTICKEINYLKIMDSMASMSYIKINTGKNRIVPNTTVRL